MKKAALFVTILALALGVSAQTTNFGALPTALSPTALPNGFSGLDWSGFYYVDPSWSGAGDGFKQGPSALNVAFVGGRICEMADAVCSGSILFHAGENAVGGFQPQSAIVAAGFHAETVSVSAYNHGKFVGSHAYNLATALQQIDFPISWGPITQLVMETTQGTVVLYALTVRPVTANAISQPPTALNSSVLPTAPKGIIDPRNDTLAGSGPSGPPVQNVGPAVLFPILDPPPPGRLAADGIVSQPGVVEPPILYSGPNAIRTGASAPQSDSASVPSGGVSPPILYSGPNAIRSGASSPQ